jgi:Hemerythrin HHE cation binding domain
MNPIVKQLSPSATKMIRMDHAHVMAQFHKIEPGMSPDTRAAIVRSICAALEIHAQLEEEIFYPALRECGLDLPALAKSVPEHEEMRRLIERVRSTETEGPRPRRTGSASSGDVGRSMGNTMAQTDASNEVASESAQPPQEPPVTIENEPRNAQYGAQSDTRNGERRPEAPDAAVNALMNAVLHHVADEETQLLPAAERVLGKRRLAELGAEMTARRMELARPRAGELARDLARGAPAKTALITVGALVAGSLLVSSLRQGRHHH